MMRGTWRAVRKHGSNRLEGLVKDDPSGWKSIDDGLGDYEQADRKFTYDIHAMEKPTRDPYISSKGAQSRRPEDDSMESFLRPVRCLSGRWDHRSLRSPLLTIIAVLRVVSVCKETLDAQIGRLIGTLNRCRYGRLLVDIPRKQPSVVPLVCSVPIHLIMTRLGLSSPQALVDRGRGRTGDHASEVLYGRARYIDRW